MAIDDDLEFRCDVHRDDHRIAIEMSGEIDVAIKENLNAELETLDRMLASNRVRAITIDMSHVSFCDSTGVAFLLRAQDRTARSGASFELLSISVSVQTVLDALALDDIVNHT